MDAEWTESGHLMYNVFPRLVVADLASSALPMRVGAAWAVNGCCLYNTLVQHFCLDPLASGDGGSCDNTKTSRGQDKRLVRPVAAGLMGGMCPVQGSTPRPGQKISQATWDRKHSTGRVAIISFGLPAFQWACGMSIGRVTIIPLRLPAFQRARGNHSQLVEDKKLVRRRVREMTRRKRLGAYAE